MTTLTPTPTAGPEAPDRRARRWPAVLTLALASPLVAEVALGSLPFSQAWTLVLVGWVYAAGPCWSARSPGGAASVSAGCSPWASRTRCSRRAWPCAA